MVMQIGGASAGGMAKKADAKLQAEVATMNAGVAETTAQTNTVLAQLPQIAAKLDTQKIKDAIRVAQGAETAAYSTANLDPASGAPLLVAGITAGQGAVDLALTRAQANLSTAARLADAASNYAGAATERFKVVAADNEAANAMTAAFFGAGSALIGGLQSMGFTGGSLFGSGGGAAETYSGGFARHYSAAPSIFSTPAYSGGSSRIYSTAYAPGDRDYRGQ
jgi:hypothetical protein